MTAALTTVGFVGLGQMGQPMALNLLRDDTRLIAMARSTHAFAALQARGAHCVTELAPLAEAELVFLCLPDTATVRETVLGDGGLLQHLPPSALIVDTSTIEHAATLALHALCAERGIGWLDAPISGMQARAEAGTLTVMAGGEAAQFERARPWLERIGNSILYMGGPGSGQLTKLVNQLLFDIHCAALAEILPMSLRMGLDAEKVATVINSGTGRSYASEFFLPRILDNRFQDGYPLQAAYKDLVSAAELGARQCLPMPVLAAATATYQMALLAGHGDKDKGAMIALYEDMLGVQFRAARHDREGSR